MEFLKKFTKKDLIFSIITGLITGIAAWRVLVFLGLPILNFWNKAICDSYCAPDGGPCTLNLCLPDYLISFSTYWLVLIIPILWMAGVMFGYFLGRWMPFFNQFGKYASIGFANSAVDFGVLNLLIAYSGITAGLVFSVFKALSFTVAVTHSYFWNRYWAFNSGPESHKGVFTKFITVNIIVALINVGTASFIVNGMDPQFGLDYKTWANVGAFVGAAVSFVFNFVGFRLIVFKEKINVIS